MPKATNRPDFVKECQSGALDGVVAAYKTLHIVSYLGLFDEELIWALPKSMRVLAHCGKYIDSVLGKRRL